MLFRRPMEVAEVLTLNGWHRVLCILIRRRWQLGKAHLNGWHLPLAGVVARLLKVGTNGRGHAEWSCVLHSTNTVIPHSGRSSATFPWFPLFQLNWNIYLVTISCTPMPPTLSSQCILRYLNAFKKLAHSASPQHLPFPSPSPERRKCNSWDLEAVTCGYFSAKVPVRR